MNSKRQYISVDYYSQSKRISDSDLSIIRSIIETKHKGNYSTISLGLGELNFPMPEMSQIANSNTIRQGNTGYTPNAGLPELRDLVARQYSQKLGLALSRNNVIITSGSTGALHITFETFLNPDDEVLIPELSYPLYKTLPEKWGAKVIYYHLKDNFDIDVSDILHKITSKTKLVIINSPSNPTGQVVSRTALLELANGTKMHKSLFYISDETYSTCVFADATHNSLASVSNRVIIIDGLSKRARFTGKRIGWIIGPDYFINDAIKAQQSTYVCAPIDSQFSAFPILEGLCDNELIFYSRELDKRRKLMQTKLRNILHVKFLESKGAFYYFVDVSNFGDGLTVAKKLIEKVNVITIPGIAFGIAGEKYLRLSYAASLDEIRKGLQRMKGVFSKWE